MKIFCVGRNYAAHAAELNNEVPDEPVIFMKPKSALLQAHTPFYYPEFTNELHYECELVLRVSKNGKYIQDRFANKYYDALSVGIDFTARDIQPYLRHGSVFDNQKAVTVRSAFLQNKEYMDAFYSSGYTVLEMEAGPFLGATYEMVNPSRVPTDEVLHLSAHTKFDVGIVHYASDTPYSRRQSLLSKSLSYFGVDSTYACSIAITRRILQQEIARL